MCPRLLLFLIEPQLVFELLNRSLLRFLAIVAASFTGILGSVVLGLL